ncbi:MAG: hypothetical protein COB37_11005 [Kordiimonadales bacterium]|nr:MAG: hypothetical protein COB37_11005 [Kordiimonadales bacterium]
MADSFIDYDARVQNALRQVVKEVLADTARDGLQGGHHFYVAFKTQAEGVSIPPHLVSRFPDEMTIVVQHKFWGLDVLEEHFEIGLSFNQKPEHLIIPFAAIVGFVDPSVQFALQFNDENEETAPETAEQPQFEKAAASLVAAVQKAPLEQEQDAEPTPAPTTGGDNIVTLDAFRRK